MLQRSIKMARAAQLILPTRPTWGGRRRGAGRKLTPGRRPCVPHRTRAFHRAAHPVHVTLRGTLRCFRSAKVFPAIRIALAHASDRGFRIVHFSVQENHLHLIVEGDSATTFPRGIRGLTIRLARAVNRALGRHGRIWADRYHARALTTPRAVRHALVYVLRNRQKHQPGEVGLDRCSSASWFDGWRERIAKIQHPSPVTRARTWLAAVGWRRHGLLSLAERPRGSP